METTHVKALLSIPLEFTSFLDHMILQRALYPLPGDKCCEEEIPLPVPPSLLCRIFRFLDF